MLKNILIDSYSTMIEIVLWLYFIGAIVLGFLAGADVGGHGISGTGGMIGMILGLIAAFIIAMLFITPFLLIVDIRDRVKRIEELKSGSQ